MAPWAEQQHPVEKSRLPLSLVAVVHDRPRRPSWSAAVIRDADQRTGIFEVGDPIRGATVAAIEETRVYLDRGDRRESLDLTGGPSSAQPPPPARPSDPLSRQLDRGIRKTGEYAYDVDRATLESLLQNTNLLTASARIVPEVEDGRAAGFRLYSVRPDGPFARIGLQNGDVISSVNGLDLTSVEKAVQVYARLQSASHASLGLERNGRRVTLEYGIR